jgi:hypothetical protein
LVVANPLLALIPSLGSSSQSLVVNQPNTSHSPTQESELFDCGVKPIFIGAFGHLQHSIQQFSHYIRFNVKNSTPQLNWFDSWHPCARLTPFPPKATCGEFTSQGAYSEVPCASCFGEATSPKVWRSEYLAPPRKCRAAKLSSGEATSCFNTSSSCSGGLHGGAR